jgi:hypothetical protein
VIDLRPFVLPPVGFGALLFYSSDVEIHIRVQNKGLFVLTSSAFSQFPFYLREFLIAGVLKNPVRGMVAGTSVIF